MNADDLAPRTVVDRLAHDGYLLVTIPDEARATIDTTFRHGLEFFRQPRATKLLTALPTDFGFRPYGSEYSSTADSPDLMESFTISERSAVEAVRLPNAPAQSLAASMFSSFRWFTSIATTLVAKVAGTFLRGDADEIATSLVRWSILQLNYSRPVAASQRNINEVHEDGCLLTIASVTAHGLEARRDDGRFMPLTPAHDQLLVFPGEIAYLLSGGEVRPFYHRVKAIEYLSERMSLLLFADIDPRRCGPWIENDLNAGIDIGGRVLSNSERFGLRPWVLD